MVRPGDADAERGSRLALAWQTPRMPYAHKFLPSSGEVIPFPSVQQPLTPRQRLHLAAAIVVVFIVVTPVVGFLANTIFGLSALDDYQNGYDIGLQWRESGADLNQCEAAMGARYGREVWVDREPGWGEFLAGCQDAASGEPAAWWFQVQGRVRGLGSD
jgi:hypothetical protein